MCGGTSGNGAGAHFHGGAVRRPHRVLLTDAVRTDAKGVRVGVVARSGRVRATLPAQGGEHGRLSCQP